LIIFLDKQIYVNINLEQKIYGPFILDDKISH